MNLKIGILLMWGLAFFVGLPGLLSADEPPGIVVWKLQANKGVDEADVNLISNFVANQVAKYSGAKVISESDIRTILKGEETRQQCGAEDTSCVAEIGAALGVPEAVSGDIGKMGDYWMLNLRRINVRSAEVIGRSSRNIKGDTNALIESLPQVVAELFGKETDVSTPAPIAKPEPKPKPSPPVEPGRLYVKSEPSGASLFLDGEEKGATPFKRKADVGKYNLELKLDGYKTVEESVSVKSKKTTRLNFSLERDYPMNPYKKYGYVTFFTGVGLVAFGGIATWQASATGNRVNDGDWAAEDSSRGWMGGSIAAYTLGGAAIVTGIVLWALSPGDEVWWSSHPLSAGLSHDGEVTTLSLSGRW